MLNENESLYKIIDFGIAKKLKPNLMDFKLKPPEIDYDYRF